LKEGFAVVTINYRSSSDAKFPAQIQDVKAAIRFIRGNSAAFSLDTNFIGVTGWSSGGHLAALTGTTNDVKTKIINGVEADIEGELGKFTKYSSAVDAVVDWFGPTDFLIMDFMREFI
jgi:predicted alpha/beta hydrolase